MRVPLSAHWPCNNAIRPLQSLQSIPRRMLQQGSHSDDRLQRVCADGLQAPLADEKADLVFSNLMLPWCDDLDAVLAECRRIVAPNGLLTISSFGPDTLRELRSAWYNVDRYQHVHGFIDMHDIGDALIRAGFAEPVMDVERFTLTYATVRDLLVDLRRMGSLNALPARAPGLAGRGLLSALEQRYPDRAADSRYAATFEVIYGHAWAPSERFGRRDRDGLVRIAPGRIGRRS